MRIAGLSSCFDVFVHVASVARSCAFLHFWMSFSQVSEEMEHDITLYLRVSLLWVPIVVTHFSHCGSTARLLHWDGDSLVHRPHDFRHRVSIYGLLRSWQGRHIPGQPRESEGIFDRTSFRQ